jgi:hypothetical protein
MRHRDEMLRDRPNDDHYERSRADQRVAVRQAARVDNDRRVDPREDRAEPTAGVVPHRLAALRRVWPDQHRDPAGRLGVVPPAVRFDRTSAGQGGQARFST